MQKMKNASVYQQAEAYIYDIPKFTTKNGLDHTKKLLKLLGNPGMQTKTIHVAGTNGKGSTCAFLERIFLLHGKKTGMFCSPHLVTMCERVRIGGENISEEAFYFAYKKLRAVIEEQQKQEPEFAHPSFFEFLFLMAMLIFEEKKVDIIILETGLGGRLDATNVVLPEVSVITKIGLDHCMYLGDTKEQIAYEKAGIIKENCPVVYLSTSEAVDEIFEKKARQMSAKAYPVRKSDYCVENTSHKKIDFSVHSRYYSYDSFTIPSYALYQVENATLAIKCAEVYFQKGHISELLQIDLTKEAIGTMKWEGRMEELKPDIYVDGAHNVDGIEAFLNCVKADEVKGRRILVFGVVEDKDYQEMIHMLMSEALFDEVILTGMSEKRALDVHSLQKIFSNYTQIKQHSFEVLKEALTYAIKCQMESDRVYIVGSLYLVGLVKPLIEEIYHD